MSLVLDGTSGMTAPQGAVYNGIASGTAVASTSGTSITFTGIPSWAKRVTVMMQQVSASGTSPFIVQLGTVSGIETTSYTGTGGSGTSATGNTVGYIVSQNQSAAANYDGIATITNISGNTWVCSGTSAGQAYVVTVFAGAKTLAGVLTQLRFTTVNGTDTFDAGSINIMYE